MGFLDDAASLIDSGVTAARGAVSVAACEQLRFMGEFIGLCRAGAESGYHECNGGNASLLLVEEEVSKVRHFFYDQPGSWVPLAEAAPALGGRCLVVTASGAHLCNVAAAPAEHCGIIQLDGQGAAWRAVWGLKGGGRPTSELGAHLLCRQIASAAGHSEPRVLYHCHPASIAALTALVPADSKVVTNLLWRSLTESVIAFPEGVAVLPWMVPGSEELACATAEALTWARACLWRLHGVFAAGSTCDSAFGLVQAIDKAATVALMVRQAQGSQSAATLSDDDLRAIARAYNLPLNRSFL